MRDKGSENLFNKFLMESNFMPWNPYVHMGIHNDSKVILKKDPYEETVVEIIDADERNLDYFKENAENSKDLIYSVTSKNMVKLFKIYIFSEMPSEEIFKAIRAGQLSDAISKRYVATFIVDLKENRFLKLFENYIKSEDIDSVLNGFIEAFGVVNVEDKQIENIIKNKKDIMRLTIKTESSFFSYLFIGINVLVYLVLYLLSLQSGGDQETSYLALLQVFGAKNNASIIAGEYWRFITPIFLHGGLLHLIFNSYSTLSLSIVEKIFGNRKFAVIYIVAGICGNIASFAFSDHPSVGASGAIFGCLGALMYFGVERKEQYRVFFRHGIMITLVINLGYGFVNPMIDNFAHLGGLFGGFLAAGILRVGNYKDNRLQSLAYGGILLMLAATCIIVRFME